MKHSAFILASALILAAPVGVLAQERQPGQEPQSQPQQRAQLSADAHHVIGKKAVNAQGKDVGKIDDILIGQDGKVQALVLDVKGKKRAIPWSEVSMRADQLTVNMSDQQLSQLPVYKGESD
ncbi:MAG TPA: PRC-barrel domain-containing protein [Magnetospirillum sp.]|nr:PRC-barrel domain-containing protein [Magnetospirillum sp.]